MLNCPALLLVRGERIVLGAKNLRVRNEPEVSRETGCKRLILSPRPIVIKCRLDSSERDWIGGWQ